MGHSDPVADTEEDDFVAAAIAGGGGGWNRKRKRSTDLVAIHAKEMMEKEMRLNWK